jgi:hypothetical protein
VALQSGGGGDGDGEARVARTRVIPVLPSPLRQHACLPVRQTDIVTAWPSCGPVSTARLCTPSPSGLPPALLTWGGLLQCGMCGRCVPLSFIGVPPRPCLAGGALSVLRRAVPTLLAWRKASDEEFGSTKRQTRTREEGKAEGEQCPI